MHKIIEDLNWRYATKKFDATQKINNENLLIIQESLRLTPSSYGLQPWKFLIIENSSLRDQLKAAAYGQSPITDASHLIVICAYSDMTEEHIDQHIENTGQTRSIPNEKLEGYGNFVKQATSAMSLDQKASWNAKQTYIALGQLLSTCASLRIDSLPMEGFDKKQFDEILNLKQKGLTATLCCPIGYRHEEDHTQQAPKVRRTLDDLVEVL